MQFTTIPLFPSLISVREKVFNPEKTLYLIEELYKKEPESLVLSNEGGWQKNIDVNQTEIIQSLKPVFDCVENFFDSEILLKPNLTVSIDHLWANVNPTNCFNWDHNHGNYFYSGVIYLKTPPESGKISFVDPSFLNDLFLAEETKARWNLYGQYFFQPKEGDLFLFPSTILHRVYPNKSKENRISIAFNLSATFE